MSEHDILIQAMTAHAARDIEARPVNDWFEACVSLGGDRIKRVGGTKQEAAELVRLELHARFRSALDALLSGGVDVPRLIMEANKGGSARA